MFEPEDNDAHRELGRHFEPEEAILNKPSEELSNQKSKAERVNLESYTANPAYLTKDKARAMIDDLFADYLEKNRSEMVDQAHFFLNCTSFEGVKRLRAIIKLEAPHLATVLELDLEDTVKRTKKALHSALNSK
ncbi:MAG: hypothetical protein P0S95_02515 [Rhabdochlamydiaceae bacterium]|nr:hypothetical protein [Candidatus Amphrikana amoebophyrae]